MSSPAPSTSQQRVLDALLWLFFIQMAAGVAVEFFGTGRVETPG